MIGCPSRGGRANWDCTLYSDHEGPHIDGIGRTFTDEESVRIITPVIKASSITNRIAEQVLDGYLDSGEVLIDGVRVAFYRDPFDREFVWFFNPGEDIEEEDDERIIARFNVVKTVERY